MILTTFIAFGGAAEGAEVIADVTEDVEKDGDFFWFDSVTNNVILTDGEGSEYQALDYWDYD